MTPERTAVARGLAEALYGPPTATIAWHPEGHAGPPPELDVLIQIDDDLVPRSSTLATAGMSAVPLEGTVERAELLLRVEGEHTVEQLEPLARALGGLATATVQRRLSLAGEVVVTDAALPGLGDRGAGVVLTAWSGDHRYLPGVSPQVNLIEVWPLTASEVELALARGFEAVRELRRAARARRPSATPAAPRAPATPPAPSIESVADRLDAWLATHAPRVRAELGAGATPKQLAHLEQTLGVELPADLAAWLMLHDGRAALGSYALLSAEGIAATWSAWIRRAEDYRRTWIPVAEDGGLNLVCVDVEPGDAGRIVFFEVRGAPERSGLPTFTAWLAGVVDRLEGGAFETDDSGQLVPR